MIPINAIETKIDSKNKIFLAPFIESFNEKGEVTINMGHEFIPGLHTHIINDTVLQIAIISKIKKTPKNITFNWKT